MPSPTRSETKHQTWVFSPLFLTAIAYAVVLRLVEIYLSVTTTMSGLPGVWRDHVIGGFGLLNIVFLTAFAFIAVAILDALRSPKTVRGWMALVFCALLAVYALGIHAFTEAIIGLGLPFDLLEPVLEKGPLDEMIR